MSLDKFLLDPWIGSHTAYANSFLNISPAPEYANSEVIVSSLYRASGYEGLAEGKVAAAGREFDKASTSLSRAAQVRGSVSAGTWATVLHGVLESPRLPHQSSRKALQLCPIVPQAALYSGAARPGGNPWNPGKYVERMVHLGASDHASAARIWQDLNAALSVDAGDDIWARWLASEFDRRSKDARAWAHVPLCDEERLPSFDKVGIEYPAKQLVRDVSAVIAAKARMTRRQWISLLEAILRLGSVMHMLWLCQANDRLWRMVVDAMNGSPVPAKGEMARMLLAREGSVVAYNNPLLPIVRDNVSHFLAARLGLNLVLWRLADAGQSVPSLHSIDEIQAFIAQVARARGILQAPSAQEQVAQLRDTYARVLACKKGTGKNMEEFARHALGQRQAANELLRGYDQGYFLRKAGKYSSAPLVVSLGPVALLGLVHCCLDEVDGPRSVQRLSLHLARYGLGINHDDVGNSDLGQNLRMLGLVLDSPDAESGMLLVPPFAKSVRATGQSQ